jgi:hypothetical protein
MTLLLQLASQLAAIDGGDVLDAAGVATGVVAAGIGASRYFRRERRHEMVGDLPGDPEEPWPPPGGHH